MRIVNAVASAMLILSSIIVTFDNVTADERSIESLGQELLEGLKPDVLGRPAAQAPADATRDATQPIVPASRFDDLGDDVGSPSPGPLALARIRHGMEQAASLLNQQPIAITDVAAAPTPVDVQQQVLQQLDELIAELSKQCQGGQCQSGDQASPNQTPQANSQSAAAGQSAAPDSNTRLGQSTRPAIEKADLGELVKGLWGHLPERSREQMLQTFSDEFLPEYELEIEQYYRRLSGGEDDQRVR